MLRHSWKVAVLLAGVAGLFAVEKVEAGMIPTNVSVLPDSGDFRWTYAVVVTTDVSVKPGDYFTIYDFDGLVAGSIVTPTDWAVSVVKNGPTPVGTSPADDPLIDNITFKYMGETPISGQQGLGNFMANSTLGDKTTSDFTSITHRQVDGRAEANITTTDVPVPSAMHDTPEPATLAMFGVGLPLLGVLRFLRRRKK